MIDKPNADYFRQLNHLNNPGQALREELRSQSIDECDAFFSALESVDKELLASVACRLYTVFGEFFFKNVLDFSRAIYAYQKSLEFQEYSYARLGLVCSYAMLRRVDSVLSQVKEIDIDRLPNAACAAQLMLALARVGEFKTAAGIFSEASLVFPDSYDLHFAKSKCEFIRGNPVAARQTALCYIKDSSDTEEHKELLRREFASEDDFVEFEYRGQNFTMIYPEFASDAHRKARSGFGELEVLEFLSANYSNQATIVDVGCHVGNHSRYFQTFLNCESIIGFDAARNAGMYYCRNVPGAIFYNIPLGRSGEEIELYGDIINARFGQSGVAVGNQILRPEARLVKTRALDEFGLQNVTLIKIDVEGWELAVLEGAMETIKRSKPLLLFEVFLQNRALYEKFISEKLHGYRIVRSFGDQSWKKHDILVEYGASSLTK